MPKEAASWIVGSQWTVLLQNHNDRRDGGDKRECKTEEGLKIQDGNHNVTFQQKQKFFSRGRTKVKSKTGLY